jgi:FtsZ-binding cell division protein ZapB
MLTLGEAAKASTVTKSAISKAIKNGRISAHKDEKGYYQIDPAELFRVFPVDTGNSQATVESVQKETGMETSGLQSTVEHLRELLDEIKNERDDLRQRLDKSEDERRATQSKLTALLTHQPEVKAAILPTLSKRSSAEAAGVWKHVWIVLAILSICTTVLAWVWWQGH